VVEQIRWRFDNESEFARGRVESVAPSLVTVADASGSRVQLNLQNLTRVDVYRPDVVPPVKHWSHSRALRLVQHWAR
jgi:hypothetical protein